MKSAAKLLLRNEPILPPDVTPYDFAMSDFFSSMHLHEDNWFGWRVILKVRSGMVLNKKELKFFDKVSGGLRYRRGKMPKNICGILGRKSAKSTIGVGMDTAYDGLRFDPKILAPGEEARALIICPNFRTSLIDIKFVEGMIESHEALSEHLISRKQTEQIAELVLSNGLTISLVPVSAVTGRGPSTKKLVLDEASFFKQRGQFCDRKIFEDARPGMIRFGDDASYSIWSSPGRKGGLVWDLFRRYHGVENDEVLVLNAASREFNPTLSEKFIQMELEARGESYVRREYLGEFVDAIESAYSEHAINRCANLDTPPSPTAERFGVMDPAGLSPQSINNDEFTAAVGHVSSGITMADAEMNWSANPDAKPRVTSPKIAITAAIKVFKEWKVKKVYVDRFKIDWVRGELEEAGLEVEMTPNKNDLYLLLETGLNSEKIKVSKDPIQVQQLKSLERSSGRGERDRIDSPREEHEDRANRVALLYYAGTKYKQPEAKKPLSDVHAGGYRDIKTQFGNIGNAADEFGGTM